MGGQDQITQIVDLIRERLKGCRGEIGIETGMACYLPEGNLTQYEVTGFEHGIRLMGDQWRIGLNKGPFPYWTDPDPIYQSGEMVICAIQYTCPEEQIGFRYENPVLIEAGGCDALSRFPFAIEEI